MRTTRPRSLAVPALLLVAAMFLAACGASGDAEADENGPDVAEDDVEAPAEPDDDADETDAGDDAEGIDAGDAAGELPTEVPDGIELVVADNNNRNAKLFELSGEAERLTADVSWANFSSGPARLEAIRAGHAHLGTVGDVPPILAQFSDAGVRIVGATEHDGAGSLITTSPDSDIETLEDLAGKKIAINEGTAQQAVLLRNLDAVGLSFDDIEPVNLDLGDFADGLLNNQIDAAVVRQPDRARYLATAEENGAVALDNAPGATVGLSYIYGSEDALADPDLAAAIREFIIRWYRAEEWRNENPDAWAQGYYVEDQNISAEDAQLVVEAEEGDRWSVYFEDVVDTQQETVDLLQAAGAFAGRELDARGQFDFRFGELSADDDV